MIPALTMVAEGVGIFGGWFVSTQIHGVDNYYFWSYSDRFVTAFDVVVGVLKSMSFGAAIAIIACHRGFRCGSWCRRRLGHAATGMVRRVIHCDSWPLDFILGCLRLDSIAQTVVDARIPCHVIEASMTKTLAKRADHDSQESSGTGSITAELVHVNRSFGRQAVLRDISIRVRMGKTLVLIGESGCGKSVTTKLLA